MWQPCVVITFWQQQQKQLRVLTLLTVVKSREQEGGAAVHLASTVAMGGRHSQLLLTARSFLFSLGPQTRELLPIAREEIPTPVNPV